MDGGWWRSGEWWVIGAVGLVGYYQRWYITKILVLPMLSLIGPVGHANPKLKMRAQFWKLLSSMSSESYFPIANTLMTTYRVRFRG